MEYFYSYGIFNDTKYARWYFSIIKQAKERSISGYIEKHHVIPWSFFGENYLTGDADTKENLVILTAKEHFICHLLLVKSVIGKYRYKAAYAVRMFTAESKLLGNRKVDNSRIYASVKLLWAEYSSSIHKNKVMSEETKAKISKTLTGRPSKKKNIPLTSETRKKISESGKGIKKPYLQEVIHCPYCDRDISNPNNAKRWHFDNCKKNPNYIKPVSNITTIYSCPHCGKESTNRLSMQRFHFDNCKKIK